MMWHNGIRQNANYEWAIFENFYTIEIAINFGIFPDDMVKDCLHQIVHGEKSRIFCLANLYKN